jgi:hypothetical protein
MNWEEFRLMPLEIGPPFPPKAKSSFSVPLLDGSGKFATPCERMHETYARAARYLALLAPFPVAADDGARVVDVVEPRCATPRDAEPLPHADRPMAITAINAISGMVIRRRRCGRP